MHFTVNSDLDLSGSFANACTHLLHVRVWAGDRRVLSGGSGTCGASCVCPVRVLSIIRGRQLVPGLRFASRALVLPTMTAPSLGELWMLNVHP